MCVCGGGGGGVFGVILSQLMFKTVSFPHVRGKLGHCLGQSESLIIKIIK